MAYSCVGHSVNQHSAPCVLIIPRELKHAVLPNYCTSDTWPRCTASETEMLRAKGSLLGMLSYRAGIGHSYYEQFFSWRNDVPGTYRNSMHVYLNTDPRPCRLDFMSGVCTTLVLTVVAVSWCSFETTSPLRTKIQQHTSGTVGMQHWLPCVCDVRCTCDRTANTQPYY